jgi:hypothetical protein
MSWQILVDDSVRGGAAGDDQVVPLTVYLRRHHVDVTPGEPSPPVSLYTKQEAFMRR